MQRDQAELVPVPFPIKAVVTSGCSCFAIVDYKPPLLKLASDINKAEVQMKCADGDLFVSVLLQQLLELPTAN